MKRRDLVRVLGVASAVSIAGCSGDSGSSPTDENPVGTEASREVPAPDVTLPSGWEVTTPDTESRTFATGSWNGILDWKAIGHTKRYENKQLRGRVKRETFEKFDNPLVVGFATRVELEVFGGDLVEGVITSATNEVQSKAKSEFRDRMSEFGIENVSEAGTMERENGSPSQFTRFRGSYPVDPIKVDGVNIPEVEQDSFSVEGGDIQIEGILAVWRSNSHIFIAGGVYPAENYTRTKSWDLTGSVELILDINMGLNRAKYLSQVVNFVQSVSA